MNNYVSQPDLNSSSREINLHHKVNSPKLPKINIPSFSGNYADWENFRDLFEALIVRNDSLSSIVRFQYLNASLTGEAENLIKHVKITEANFQSTWETIKKRYDNKRALIVAHLNEILKYRMLIIIL